MKEERPGPKQLHIYNCIHPLSRAELEILTRLMPNSGVVRALSVADDYEVRTEAQIRQLQKDLSAVRPEMLSETLYERGEYIEPRAEADLLNLLRDIVNATAT